MNKTFNRRQAFGLLATSLGMIYTMKSALAQTAPDAPTLECPPLPKKLIKVVESEISKNHGHEFTIEMDQLIKESGNSFSIQGDSGHAHKILIAADQIVKLLQGQKVVIVSSTDAGHAHSATLLLTEVESVS